MNDFSDDETLLGDNAGSSSGGSSLVSGSRLGDYEIEKLIGAGAMGEVFLARQVRLNQQCAIKVLPEILSKSADFEKRFESEGRSLARLDHPSIVRVMYAGVESGRHFLTMEYVGGGSLDDFLARRGALSEAEVRRILSEILAGLAYAHKREVIHRDLKPANILCSVDGHAKISDFGLALVAGEEYMRTVVETSLRLSRIAGAAPVPSKKPSFKPSVNLDTDETIRAEDLPTTGRSAEHSEDETLLESEVSKPSSSKRPSSGEASAFVGTIDYMSPEIRYARGAADARSDLFAIGVIAYQMLVGRKPAMGRAKDPSKIVRGLSAKWDEWVYKCMEEDPADRFQSAEEALAALPGSRNGKWWRLAAVISAVVVLLGVAIGGWWFGSRSAKNSVVEQSEPVAAPVPEKVAAPLAPVPKAENITEVFVTPVPERANTPEGSAAPVPKREEAPPAESDRALSAMSQFLPREKSVDSGSSVKQAVPESEAKPVEKAPVPVVEATGSLSITTDPHLLYWHFTKTPGNVRLPEMEGTTPVAFSNLPIGYYLVEFSREGWPKVLEAVRVEAGRSASLTHVFTGGSLDLVGDAPGVSWALVSCPNGVALKTVKGEVPQTLSNLPPGDYVLQFTKPSWPAVRKKVVVVAGETVTASVAFETAPAADSLPEPVVLDASDSEKVTVGRAGANPAGQGDVSRPSRVAGEDTEPALPEASPEDVFIPVTQTVQRPAVKQAVEKALLSDKWKIEKSDDGTIRAVHELNRTLIGSLVKGGNVSDAVFEIHYNNQGILIKDLTTDEDNERVNKKWSARLKKLIENNLRRAR
jgi:serine/threonine protein kinase